MTQDPKKELWTAIQSNPDTKDLFVDESDFDSLLTADPKGVYTALEPSGLFVDYADFESVSGLKKKGDGAIVSPTGSETAPTPSKVERPVFKSFKEKPTEEETKFPSLKEGLPKTAQELFEEQKPTPAATQKKEKEVVTELPVSGKLTPRFISEQEEARLVGDEGMKAKEKRTFDQELASTQGKQQALTQISQTKEQIEESAPGIDNYAKLYEQAQEIATNESNFKKKLEFGDVATIQAYAPGGRLSQNIEEQRKQKETMLSQHEERLKIKNAAADKAAQQASKQIESIARTEIERNPEAFKELDATKSFDVVNSAKIEELADKIASDAGMATDSNFRRLAYNVIKQNAEYNLIKKDTEAAYEKAAKDILQKYQQEYEKGFKTPEEERKRIESEMAAFEATLLDDQKQEINPLETQYKEFSTSIQDQWKLRSAQIDAQLQGLNKAYEQGAINQTDYTTQFNQIQSQAESELQQVNTTLDSAYNQYVKEINDVNTRYTRKYKQEANRLESIANQRIAEAQKEYEAKYGKNPELQAQLEAAYKAAYNLAAETRKVKIDVSERDLAAEGIKAHGIIPLGSVAVFSKQMLNGMGGVMKGWGQSIGSVGLEDFGNYMETKFIGGEVKSENWVDLLDPVNVVRSTGQLIGSMGPSTLATAATAYVSGGASVMGRLAASGAVGWAAETADIAGRAYLDEFEKNGGNVALAEDARRKSIESQVILAPAYALEGLPFIKGILSRVPTKVGRIATGAAIELGTEFIQEYPQNIASENIARGLDPFDNFLEQALNAKNAKETFISIAPVAILGGAGQITSKSRKQMLADYMSAQFTKQNVSDVFTDQYNQYIQNLVFNEGQKTANAVATMMYSGGVLNDAQYAEMTLQIENTLKYSEAADAAGISKSDKKVYGFFASRADQARKAAEQSNDPILSKVYEKQAQEYEKDGAAFLSGEKPNVLRIQYKDGSEFLMTPQEAKTLLGMKKFADEVKNGNISVSAFNEEGQTIIEEYKQGKYDKKDEQGIPSGVREGEAPVSEQPVEGAGAEAIEAGGVLQAQEELNKVRERLNRINAARERGELLEDEFAGELKNLKAREKELSAQLEQAPQAQEEVELEPTVAEAPTEELSGMSNEDKVDYKLDEIHKIYGGNRFVAEDKYRNIGDVVLRISDHTPNAKRISENQVNVIVATGDTDATKRKFSGPEQVSSRTIVVSPDESIESIQGKIDDLVSRVQKEVIDDYKKEISKYDDETLSEELSYIDDNFDGVSAELRKEAVREEVSKRTTPTIETAPSTDNAAIGEVRLPDIGVEGKREGDAVQPAADVGADTGDAEATGVVELTEQEELDYAQQWDTVRGSVMEVDPNLSDAEADYAATMVQASNVSPEEAVRMAKENPDDVAAFMAEEAVEEAPMAEEAVTEGEVAADNVGKFLSDSGISVEVLDDADYKNTVSTLGGQQSESEGIFVADDKKVYINRDKIKNEWGKTIAYHEGTHPVINIIRNTSPALYKTIVSGIMDAAKTNPNVARVVNMVKNNPEYKKAGQAVIEDETVVEVLAQIAAGKLDFGTFEKTTREKIIDFMNTLAEFFGLPKIALNSPRTEVQNLAKKLTDALNKQGSIADVVGKKRVGEFQNTIINSIIGQSSITTFGRSGITKKPSLDDDKFIKKLKENQIDIKSPKESLSDEFFMMTFPDDLFVGEIVIDGKVIAKFGGGVIYALVEGDKGRMWASVNETTAGAFANNVNKALEASKDGVARVVLVKGSHTKHATSLAAKVGFVKTLLNYTKNKPEHTQSLINAIKKAYSIGNEKQIDIVIKQFDNYLSGTREESGQTMKEAADSYATFRSALVKDANALLVDLAKEMGYGNEYFDGTALKKSPPIYKAKNELVDKIFADMLQEDFLNNLPEGSAYAVLKVTSQVKVVKDNSHPSYPYVIRTIDGSPVTVDLFSHSFMAYGVNEAITGRAIKEGEVSKAFGSASFTTPSFKLKPNVNETTAGTVDLGGKIKKYKTFTIDRSLLNATPERITKASENLQAKFRRDGIPLSNQEAVEIVQELASWKDWYEGIAQMVQDNFEEYAADYMMFMFGSAVAADSAGTIGTALNNLERLYAQEEIKGLPIMKRNIYEILSGLPVTSDKISNFIAAGLGDKNAIPVDMHVWSFINSFPTTKTPTKKDFDKAKEFVRAVADGLGWDPREVQAAMWAANMLRLGQKPDTYEEYIQKKIDSGLQKQIQGWRDKGYKPVFAVRQAGEKIETVFLQDAVKETFAPKLEEVKQKISKGQASAMDRGALKDVESTAKALEAVDKVELNTVASSGKIPMKFAGTEKLDTEINRLRDNAQKLTKKRDAEAAAEQLEAALFPKVRTSGKVRVYRGSSGAGRDRGDSGSKWWTASKKLAELFAGKTDKSQVAEKTLDVSGFLQIQGGNTSTYTANEVAKMLGVTIDELKANLLPYTFSAMEWGGTKLHSVIESKGIQELLAAKGIKGVQSTDLGGKTAYFEFSDDVIESGKQKAVNAGQAMTQQDVPYEFTKNGGNKIVDENGNPIKVYHGTTANDFVGSEFVIGWDVQGLGGGSENIGVFFGNMKQAKEVSEGSVSYGAQTTGKRIIPAYINLRNPLRLKKDAQFWFSAERVMDALKTDPRVNIAELQELVKKHEAKGRVFVKKPATATASFEVENDTVAQVIRPYLQQKGFDGIVYDNQVDAVEKDGESSGESYIVFDPKNIIVEGTASKRFSLDGKTKFYHASNQKRRGRLKPNQAQQFGVAVYFSTNKEIAQEEFGEEVTEVALNLNNPVFTNTNQWNQVIRRAIQMADDDYGKKRNLTLEEDDTYFRYDPDNSSEVAEIPSTFISDAAIELGHDAIIDEGSADYENEIAVLDESKIIYEEDIPLFVSQAYHAAKKDGSNPELVRAVEELLSGERLAKGQASAAMRREARPTVRKTSQGYQVISADGKPLSRPNLTEGQAKSMAEKIGRMAPAAPAVSEAISEIDTVLEQKGKNAAEARRSFKERYGQDAYDRAREVTLNFDKIINDLEQQGRVRKDCP